MSTPKDWMENLSQAIFMHPNDGLYYWERSGYTVFDKIIIEKATKPHSNDGPSVRGWIIGAKKPAPTHGLENMITHINQTKFTACKICVE